MMEDPIPYQNLELHSTPCSANNSLVCSSFLYASNAALKRKNYEKARKYNSFVMTAGSCTTTLKRKRQHHQGHLHSNKNQSLIIIVQPVPRLIKESSYECGRHYIYDWNKSTEDNYTSLCSKISTCHGNYKHIRETMDYSYHNMYTKSRQVLQDAIIDKILGDSSSSSSNSNNHSLDSSSSSPSWIIFTAGVMGAGKTHTIRRLHNEGKLAFLNCSNSGDNKPRHPNLLTIDPDYIRHQLPEFQHYVKQNPEMAGVHTQKEAGMIAEIATKLALSLGRNVVVDGSFIGDCSS